MAQGLQITSLHDHHSAFFELVPLVFGTRNLLDCIPVLIEAREVPTGTGRGKLDVLEGGMSGMIRSANVRAASNSASLIASPPRRLLVNLAQFRALLRIQRLTWPEAASSQIQDRPQGADGCVRLY